MNPFAALGLSGELVHTLENFGFNSPTPIQKKAIPEVLAGKDPVSYTHLTLPTSDLV